MATSAPATTSLAHVERQHESVAAVAARTSRHHLEQPEGEETGVLIEWCAQVVTCACVFQPVRSRGEDGGRGYMRGGREGVWYRMAGRRRQEADA